MSELEVNFMEKASHCCQCAGVCYHIPMMGTDCGRHDRVNVPGVPFTRNSSTICQGHCYCKRIEVQNDWINTASKGIPHKKCCNCGHQIKAGEL